MNGVTPAGLTEGRIVHYVLPNGDHRPAIIVRNWAQVMPDGTQNNPNGCVNLQVFTDSSNDGLLPVEWRTSVQYDDSETPAPYTWHFPERARDPYVPAPAPEPIAESELDVKGL